MPRIVSCPCCSTLLLCEYCAKLHATSSCPAFKMHFPEDRSFPDDGDATPEECAAIGLRLVV